LVNFKKGRSMKKYTYLDEKGTFRLENPELTSYLYFPIANERGVLSCVTPNLGGDSKLGQNTFLLPPVSSEDLHNNKSSRNFWCNITGRGSWSATGKSARQQALLYTDKKEETVLEAGIMWQKVSRTSKEEGITSQILSFVPATEDLVELMIVTLKNTGTKKLEVTPTAAVPLYGRSADNIRDHRHVTSLLHRIETTKNGVILNPTLTFDERGHHKNELLYGVFGGTGQGESPVGYYPCVEDFIGEGGSFENPQAIIDSSIKPVKAGWNLDGYEALGGIQFEQVTLAPFEEKTYIVVMGYGSHKEGLEASAMKYLSLAACETVFAQTKEYWDAKINVSYCAGEKEFDAWMHWVHFQPMLRRIYGCSFLPHHDYGKGGRGWRDLWQDCLALLIMNPVGVKDMLLDNFGGVRMDGTNATIIGAKQGEFIADRNNITRVWMDHGVWPFLTTNFYIQQTGDLEILLKETNYFKDPQAVRGEEKDNKWKLEDGNQHKTIAKKVYQGSILEHLLVQHLTAFYDVGEHNEIKLRGADWNDALDMAKERGESVAFTAIYAGNLQQMASLLLALEQNGIEKISLAKEIMLLLSTKGIIYEAPIQKQELLHQYCKACKYTLTGEVVELSCQELAKNLNGKAAWMKSYIQKTEWLTNQEGYSWYNGYYDNNGRQVEGDFKSGVRMMLTSQVFTIMSETATLEQVKKIAATSDAYLYEELIGGYRLNTNFKEIKTDLGRMFGFAYGHKENGAVFSHMAVMYGNALYQRGFAKEGYKVIHSLYKHCSNFEQSKIYPGVPEYIGDNGRGLYHYLTGAASWLLITVLTQMFGVKGSYGNLLFEPKLLLEQFDDNWKAKVNLNFADRNLTIVYLNRDKKEYGDYIVDKVSINDAKYKLQLENAVILRSDIEALDPDKNHVIIVKLA
jgi:cellobiose phosphorylase